LVNPGQGWSQTAQQSGTLVVSGQSGQTPILQIGGKSYVSVEALARLTNGSLSFEGNQITLTLSGSAGSTSSVPAASPRVSTGFSKDFMKAGIEAMSVVREWRGMIVNAVKNGYPVTDELMANYRAQATANLRLADVAVSTDSDRSAFQLLSRQLDTMQKLSDKILAARQNMNYVSADALRNDPLNQQILNCARSLASMAATGQFQDDGSCH
jgi:cysteinyl-tRNA synthetase